jgi:hypothetical protein
VEQAAVGDIGVEAGHGLGKVPAQGRRGEELQAGGLHLIAGLAIKKPTQKTQTNPPEKNPLKLFFFLFFMGFFLFFIFYENNTNFSL